MINVAMLAYNGCLFSSLEILADALSICNLWHHKLSHTRDTSDPLDVPLFNTQVVTANGSPFITNSGVRIMPDAALETAQHIDVILIAPYLYGAHDYPEAIPELIPLLKHHYHHNTRIGAICTASFILAQTGLLDGRIATTNWQVANTFIDAFPNINVKPDRMLTEDNGLMCTGAATSQYHLALHLIDRFGYKELVRACSKVFLVDPRRVSQTPYVIVNFRKNHGDDKILLAQQWMEAHYQESVTIDAIAERVNLSSRHFKRRFKLATDETPIAYLHHIRIDTAKQLLEGTRYNIDEITRRVGYEDSGTFRRLFKRSTSLSPREYRDRFSTL